MHDLRRDNCVVGYISTLVIRLRVEIDALIFKLEVKPIQQFHINLNVEFLVRLNLRPGEVACPAVRGCV